MGIAGATAAHVAIAGMKWKPVYVTNLQLIIVLATRRRSNRCYHSTGANAVKFRGVIAKCGGGDFGMRYPVPNACLTER